MRFMRLMAAVALTVMIAQSRNVETESYLFTHGPTDLSSVGGVQPLGGLNPGDNHVLPVDHMYINYPLPDGGGSTFYNVYAMGTASVVMILEEQLEGRAVPDYGVFMSHTRDVTSYYLHVHALNANLAGIIAAAPEESWVVIRPTFRVMLLGQRGAPAPVPVNGGDLIGFTRNYSHAWDVGVIDRHVMGDFVGRGERRYPTIPDYIRLLGLDVEPPYQGQETINAVCFLDYFPPALRASYAALLTGPSCGQVGWDAPGRLRGAWFNQAIDTAPVAPLFQLETGALSVIPDNVNPSTHVRIALGAGSEYSAFDPTRSIPQLRNAFRVAIDPAPGAHTNPDPAIVRVRSGPVCYDLAYHAPEGPRFNSVRFFLFTSFRLAIKYDPTPYATAPCASLPAAFPDETWVDYVR